MGKIVGKEKLLLAVILILGLGLRLWGINQSFWLDEASQAQLSSLSVSQIWSQRGADFHPPLFYLLAHYWLGIGRSEVWLRLLPISFGLLAVWLMYQLTPQVIGEKKVKLWSWEVNSGQISAFLLAINPFHIYYSQEFRMYSLLALLGLWCMYLFVKSSKWLWLSLTLLLYTHYAGALLFPTMLIYIIFFESKKLKYLILHFAISFLLYLPWLPQFVAQLHSGVNIDVYLPGWRSLLAVGPIKAIPLIIFKLVAGRIDFVSRAVYVVYLSYTLALVGLSIALARTKRILLLLWLFIPQVLAILVSFVIPITQPFRLIFVLPALILILTQGVLRLPRLMLLFIIYISVTGVVMYATRPRLQREQWRQASSYLLTQASPSSTVVVKFSDRFAPLGWYAPNLQVIGAVPSYPAKSSEVTAILAERLKGKDIVYVLDYLAGLSDPYSVVDKSVTDLGYRLVDTTNFEGVGFIHRYLRAI